MPARCGAGSRTSAASIREQRDYLTQLDAAIGDADHGANMDRGFTAVVEKLDGEPTARAPPGKLLHDRRLHARLDRRRRQRPALGHGPPAGRPGARRRRGVRQRRSSSPRSSGARRRRRARGGAARARRRWSTRSRRPCGRCASGSTAAPPLADGGRRRPRGRRGRDAGDGAAAGAKGRASYLGERSIGHQDPGATSTALILARARAGGPAAAMSGHVLRGLRRLGRGRGRAAHSSCATTASTSGDARDPTLALAALARAGREELGALPRSAAQAARRGRDPGGEPADGRGSLARRASVASCRGCGAGRGSRAGDGAHAERAGARCRSAARRAGRGRPRARPSRGPRARRTASCPAAGRAARSSSRATSGRPRSRSSSSGRACVARHRTRPKARATSHAAIIARVARRADGGRVRETILP